MKLKNGVIKIVNWTSVAYGLSSVFLNVLTLFALITAAAW